MLNRRDFLKVAATAALAPASCVTLPRDAGRGVLVNDIHSQLNATRVAAVRSPRSMNELQQIVRGAREICVAGGRHAMGGQQFAGNATLVDMNAMNRVIGLDSARGVIDIEAGVQWPELVAYLAASGSGWGIRQKQTGADRLTIGGAIAANAHGRGLKMKPIVSDIEAFTLITADGSAIECSRTSNRELFALAIGGYGLFGVVSSIRLRLSRRQKVERVVEIRDMDEIIRDFDRRIAEGFLYGDFQFSINEKSPNFLRRGVFSCYRPVDDSARMAAGRELQSGDWGKLLLLAHADKERAYEEYTRFYLSTSGQVYWSDEHQLSVYLDDYHRELDKLLQAGTRATEMITEIYVPRERLADFMVAAADDLQRNAVSVVYGTVRLIERDDETFLAWAKQNYACVIFNLHTEHSPEGLDHSANAFRRLIDLAIERDGSYFLTYHRWARREQVERCYPQLAEFLRKKREHDPRERFQSDWYRHYRTMFGA